MFDAPGAGREGGMAEQSRSGQLIARAIKQALRNCASVLSHAKGCRKCISCGCRGLGWDQVAALRWVEKGPLSQDHLPLANPLFFRLRGISHS